MLINQPLVSHWADLFVNLSALTTIDLITAIDLIATTDLITTIYLWPLSIYDNWLIYYSSFMIIHGYQPLLDDLPVLTMVNN